jgi:hypothetical protein
LLLWVGVQVVRMYTHNQVNLEGLVAAAQAVTQMLVVLG